MSTSVRAQIASQFKTDWEGVPDLQRLRVLASERNLDIPSKPTALIRQKSVGVFPQAPLSHRSVRLLLTLISPFEDFDKAGDDLDALVYAALEYLDTRFVHEDATAVMYGDRLAYDIPFTVIATKD